MVIGKCLFRHKVTSHHVFFIVFCIYCKLFLQEIMLKNENFYNFREVILNKNVNKINYNINDLKG